MSPKPLRWVGGVRCLGLFPKKSWFFFDAFPNAARKFLSGQKEVGREVWVLPAVSTSIDGSIIIASNGAINGIKYTRTNTLNDVEYKYSKPHVKSKQLIDRLHSRSTSDELSCFSTTLPGPSYMPFWFQEHNFWDLSIYDIWTLILDINHLAPSRALFGASFCRSRF